MIFKQTFASFITLSTVLSSFALANIYTDSGPMYDRTPRNNLSKAAISIGAPFKLKPICAGLGFIAGAQNTATTPWGLVFTCSDKLTLKQAQVMAHEVTTKLLKTMYEDPSFANYSVESMKAPHKPTHPPLSNKSLAFRIDFWDEEVNRPLYPYVAEIRFTEENFYYYYADPKTQGLQEPVLIEPFFDSKSLQ